MIYDLDGPWCSSGRTVMVPGPMGDPACSAPASLTRRIRLPEGEWSRAWLELDGARWCPRVTVNGSEVSSSSGGMAPLVLPLEHADVKPGAEIELGINLAAADDVSLDDASRLPNADRWRARRASGLWDSVRLRLTGPERIARLAPYTERTATGWRVHVLANAAGDLRCRIRDGSRVLAEGAAPLDLPADVPIWPSLLTLEAELFVADRRCDFRTMSLGLRQVECAGTGLLLNSQPLQLRMITVVWHRWARDSELAWDVDWFERCILKRLRNLGGNGLRFHLGLPPRRFLDLCDRHGVLVQAEWSCFHGLPATEDSLASQWSDWLDVCAAHPCVVVAHAWNECDGPEVSKGQRALERALVGRVNPPLISHLDVIHLHRYWWSMFENVGLYYDHASLFDRPAIADEFGGNYLDGDGAPGGYPAVPGSLRRFLGWHHDREQRLAFQALSNARVAEYWRRIDVAGFSPFCALGSAPDGNHWFLGDPVHDQPKPVWAALGAALHPQTALLDSWDTTCLPGALISCPVSVRNDSPKPAVLEVAVGLRRDDGERDSQHRCVVRLGPFGRADMEFPLIVPTSGTIEAEVIGTPARSSWRIRTHRPVVDPRLFDVRIACKDPEVRSFLTDHGLHLTDHSSAAVVIGDGHELHAAIQRGAGGVWLDAGEQFLGEEYDPIPRSQSPASEQPRQVHQPWTAWQQVAGGIQVRFRRVAEAESCLHPPLDGSPMWRHLPADAHRLWNGLRGGLIAPAIDWELTGLSRSAARSLWMARGADGDQLDAGTCIAYHLAGYWLFATHRDPAVESQLRANVEFLAEDAPALAWAADPRAPVTVVDAAAEVAGSNGAASSLVPLAVAGKDLVRTPVWRASFMPGQGRLCLSQCLTAGRLHPSHAEAGRWGRRFDPCAQQLVLDLIAEALPEQH